MTLNLGGLTLPPDAITQTFGVLAVRGAGKSNLAAVMAEEMYRARLPFVVVDPVGSWWGLRSSADGKSAGLEIPIFGGRHGDIPLEKTGGQVLADLVVDDRASCVLDISEFSEGDKIHFLIDFAERLYRRNTEPLHLFLEEADDYAPQRPFREQARLLRAWENVVRRGRARGLGITMITQRSAALNKNVLTQIETLFVLRTTSPQDRKAIQAWVEYHGQSRELLESLPTLKAGEAWVWSPQWLKKLERTQIRRRATFDSGATPKNVRGARPAAALADVDLGKVRERMAATIERAKATDPGELRKRITTLERELAAKPVVETKVERVEVPVMSAAAVHELQELRQDMIDANVILERLLRHADTVTAMAAIANPPASIPRRPSPAPVVQRRTPATTNGRAPTERLPDGERRILTALIQHGRCGRSQLSVLTGYKRATRDAYILRLRGRGLVDVDGDAVFTTMAGATVLGDEVEMLPTGADLLAWWLGRLPEGERAILQELTRPGSASEVTRDALSEATGYKRATRDAYLLRLRSKKLVVDARPGMVRASEELFG